MSKSNTLKKYIFLIILISLVIFISTDTYDYDYNYDYDYDYDHDYKKNKNQKESPIDSSSLSFKKIEDEYLNSLKEKSTFNTEKDEERKEIDSTIDSFERINLSNMYDTEDMIRKNNIDTVNHIENRPNKEYLDQIRRAGINKQHQAFEYDMNNNPGQSFSNKIINTSQNGVFNFISEILGLLFIFGIVYRCIYGREDYDKHVLSFINLNKDLLQSKFQTEMYYIYDKNTKRLTSKYKKQVSETAEENSFPIQVDDLTYTYNAEEGGNIKSMSIRIEVKKQADNFFVVSNFLFAGFDKIFFEINFDETNEGVKYPTTFMISTQKKLSYLVNSKSDIKAICVNDQYLPFIEKVCLSENLDLIEYLFSNEGFKNKFSLMRNSIEYVFFVENEDKTKKLTIIYEAHMYNVNKEERFFKEITVFSYLFADLICQYVPIKMDIVNSAIIRREKYMGVEESPKKHPNLNTSTNEESKVKEMVGNKEKAIKKQKQDEEKKGKKQKNRKNESHLDNEGIYAYTNSRCKELVPKSLFFS